MAREAAFPARAAPPAQTQAKAVTVRAVHPAVGRPVTVERTADPAGSEARATVVAAATAVEGAMAVAEVKTEVAAAVGERQDNARGIQPATAAARKR